MKKKYLFIVLENFNREINSKLLIVSEAINKNFTVIIGNRVVLYSIKKYLPSGAILDKGGGYQLHDIFKSLKKDNNKIFVLDEESLTYASKKQYLKLNFYKKNLKYIDNFFLSNQVQFDLLKKKNIKNPQLVLTGNPKFEFYKKKYKKIHFEIKKKLKIRNYILMTSRFGHINPNKTQLDDINKLDKTYLKTSNLIYKKFIKLAKIISNEFPKKKIIYRPHPSENEKKLLEIFKFNKNIKVVYEGGVEKYILNSLVVIHNRCTTGFESILLDKKTIHFDPIIYNSIHSSFFRILGIRCTSYSQVINSIKKINTKNFNFFKKKYFKTISKKYCEEIYNSYPEKKILNYINSKKYLETVEINLSKKFFLILISIKKFINEFLVQYFNLKNERLNLNYRIQKFGFFNKELVIIILNKIMQIKKYKFKLKFSYLCKDVMMIKKC